MNSKYLRKMYSISIYVPILNIYIVADEEFDQLCFDFGIELDEVVIKILVHTVLCEAVWYLLVLIRLSCMIGECIFFICPDDCHYRHRKRL